MTRHDAQQRVARGVAYLDVHAPGWANRIDVGRLDMSRDCFCVLGQLYGNFGKAIFDAWPDNSGVHAVQHGFLDVDLFDDDAYRLLQDEWIAVIASRRLSPAQTPQPVAVAVIA